VKPEPVAHREVLEAQVRDLSVGDANHGSVESSDARGTQSNIIDCAEDLAHLEKISYAHGSI